MDKKILQECVHYTVKERTMLFPKTQIWIRQNLLKRFEMPYLEVFITTKCNLRCKDCSNLIPKLQDMSNISFLDFSSVMGKLLSKIDRLYRLKLHGGEVFINPELPKIIKYADSLKKVKSIRLTTNGTIIPSNEVLKALRNSKVVVQISDYNLQNSKVKELIALLEKNYIKVAYLKDQHWKDMGEIAKRGTNRFNECSIKRCTSLFHERVYVCSRAAMATALGFIKENGIDINLPTTEFRQRIISLYKEDNEACFYCDGDTEYAQTIKPGIQRVMK